MTADRALLAEAALTRASSLDALARAIQEAAACERMAARSYYAGHAKSAPRHQAAARAALHLYPATLSEVYDRDPLAD